MSYWNKFIGVNFNHMEVINGEEVEVEYKVELDVRIVYDAQYGADADGNRGMPQTFIDDYKIVHVEDSLKREWDLKKLPEWMDDAINSELDDADVSDDGPDDEDDDY